MWMIIGKKSEAALTAALLALMICALSGTAYAVTPEQYRAALEQNVDNYSGSKTWRKVAGQFCAGQAVVKTDGDSFAIKNDCGEDFLSTGVACVSISGKTDGADISQLNVQIYPADQSSMEYEYQAFSLGEVAFESLIGGASGTDMSAYLFLYDVYPCAMWASDSELGDNERSLVTALDGVKYAIYSRAYGQQRSVTLTLDVLGESSDEDDAAARNNLNSNYAFESICSLVYELNTCAGTCASLTTQGDSSDVSDQLLGDMQACVDEYYALSADGYGKLEELTRLLNPQFENVTKSLEALSGEMDPDYVQSLLDAVRAMRDALKSRY